MEYVKPEVKPFDSLSVLVDGEKKTFETIFAEFESAQERKASSTVLSRLVKRLTALYNPLAEWAKEYIFRPFERLLKFRFMRNTRQNRAEAKKRDLAFPGMSKCDDRIIFTDDTVSQPDGVHQFYICRMIKDNGKVVYQKIGTTKRATATRMKEHLRDHWDKGVRKIVVDRVYDVQDNPEITVESYFRAIYGRKYKEHLVPLDRFDEAVIDLDEADKDFVKFMMGY